MSSRLIFLLAALIAAWIVAFNTGRDLAFSLSYLLLALLFLSYGWAWLSLRSLNLRRLTRARRGQVGQFVEELFEVTNRSRLPKLWLEVEDFSTLPWHDASRVVSSLRGRSTYRWQVKTLCTQRGRFRFGPMTLRSGDPLGIFERRQRLESVDHIVIFPLTVELTSFQPSSSLLSGGDSRRQRTFDVTTNVATVRDYAPGDSLNRIHWPTTARARRLMTKEFELDPTANVWVYLDLFRDVVTGMPWHPEQPELGLFGNKRASYTALPPITTEYGVTLAASLARYFLVRNRAVGMSAQGGQRWFMQTDRGERQLGKIMESLAVVEAAGKLPFAQLIATDGIRLNRNDTILAISPDPDLTWIRALRTMQRRGVNSVAIILDGTTFGAPNRDYSELYALCEASSIPYYQVSEGDELDAALAQPVNPTAMR